jgi:hypothetical protein
MRAAGVAPWFITIFLMILMRVLTTLQQVRSVVLIVKVHADKLVSSLLPNGEAPCT